MTYQPIAWSIRIDNDSTWLLVRDGEVCFTSAKLQAVVDLLTVAVRSESDAQAGVLREERDAYRETLRRTRNVARALAGIVVSLVALFVFGCTVDAMPRRVDVWPCDVEHDSPGCASPDIEGCVCDGLGDEPCCELQWDAVCVVEARACAPTPCCDATSAACGEGSVCVRALGICAASCRDVGCDPLYTCADDVCVWACADDGDCPPGQGCIGGACGLGGGA